VTTKEQKILGIQKVLFPDSPREWDGKLGPKTRAAFEALSRPDKLHFCMASSFADPEDVRAYQECMAKHHDNERCLKVGDNGVGLWGDDTTGATPACALNDRHLIEEFGSIHDAKYAPVLVTIKNKNVVCILLDTGAPYDRIDLNPGACAAFGLEPPVLEPAIWSWA
jgi:hypothetical protein